MDPSKKNKADSVELSYQMQRENFTETDEQSIRVRESWFEEDTVDFWRHHRTMVPIQPLLEEYKNDKWLTVGDGRFGLDSIRLKKMQPGMDILPTDISDELLKEAKQRKLIDNYSCENAEALSFETDSFDFVFCKESYHHFPRPYIALYEMLRVAKKGVILIEPNEKNDKMIPERILGSFKGAVKKLIGKRSVHPETWSFEESGNYIYKVSRNEMEKVGLGLQLPAVAVQYYNDYYEEGVEFEKAVPGNPVFERTKKEIAKQDSRSRRGLQVFANITVILFKIAPAKTLRSALEKTGFEIIDLPVNPYLEKRKGAGQEAGMERKTKQ